MSRQMVAPRKAMSRTVLMADVFTRITGKQYAGHPDINCGKSEKWWRESWLRYAAKMEIETEQ